MGYKSQYKGVFCKKYEIGIHLNLILYISKQTFEK